MKPEELKIGYRYKYSKRFLKSKDIKTSMPFLSEIMFIFIKAEERNNKIFYVFNTILPNLNERITNPVCPQLKWIEPI